jgi:hypothetical protein
MYFKNLRGVTMKNPDINNCTIKEFAEYLDANISIDDNGGFHIHQDRQQFYGNVQYLLCVIIDYPELLLTDKIPS